MALVSGMAEISVANPNLDGSGTLVTVLTATSDMIADMVIVKATEAVSNGVVRLFLFDGVSTNMLFHEIEVVETIPSATVAAFQRPRVLSQKLPDGWSIKASTQNAETFNVIITGTEV